MKRPSPLARKAINFVGFYVGWIGAVLLAAGGSSLAGFAVCAAIIALHVAISPAPILEARIVLILGAIGFAADSVITGLGAYTFAGPRLFGLLAPVWVFGLWAMFATTLTTSLAWLRTNLAVAAAFGLIGGPLAFYAGAKLGAIDVDTTGYVAGAIFYAIATPMFLSLAAAWSTPPTVDGVNQVPTEPRRATT